MSEDVKLPFAVKIISILYFVLAIFVIITGLFLYYSKINHSLAPLLGGLGLGIIFVIVGIGLWKGKSWSRYVTIIFCGFLVFYQLLYILILSMALSITNTIPDQVTQSHFIALNIKLILLAIFVILINILIGTYLLFNNKVKKIFTRNTLI